MLLRLASNRALGRDDRAREGDALAALQPASEPLVSATGAARAIPSGGAHLTFLNGIANTDDHDDSR